MKGLDIGPDLNDPKLKTSEDLPPYINWPTENVQLNEGETAVDFVEWMNGNLPERKGIPKVSLADVAIFCDYCNDSLTLEEMEKYEMGIEELEEYAESSPEFIYCKDCTTRAERSNCG